MHCALRHPAWITLLLLLIVTDRTQAQQNPKLTTVNYGKRRAKITKDFLHTITPWSIYEGLGGHRLAGRSLDGVKRDPGIPDYAALHPGSEGNMKEHHGYASIAPTSSVSAKQFGKGSTESNHFRSSCAVEGLCREIFCNLHRHTDVVRGSVIRDRTNEHVSRTRLRIPHAPLARNRRNQTLSRPAKNL